MNPTQNGESIAQGALMVDSETRERGVARSKLVLPEGPWSLLIDFLAERFKPIQKNELVARLHRGEIYCASGARLEPTTPYKAHQAIFYFRQVPPEKIIPFEETIIFQDNQILVADKPPFLTVVPAGRHLHETLLVRLKKRTGLPLVPMHRIDRETSGLVMFTIQPNSRGKYQSLFESKSIEKIYEAIAPFNPELILPLRYASRIEESAAFMQMHEVQGTPNAITVIQMIEQGAGLAKYKIKLETGKKHQIRIHFSALGIPILNDMIYPVLMPEGSDDYTRPLQLLAKALKFTDPISGQPREFVSVKSLSLHQPVKAA
jgi:tRNA pseudouridine32 synthase / 23S rRNA pseudouridine746 synthase